MTEAASGTQAAPMNWQRALIVFVSSWVMAVVVALWFAQPTDGTSLLMLVFFALGQGIVAVVIPPLLVLFRGTTLVRAMIAAALLNAAMFAVIANSHHRAQATSSEAA